MTWGGPPPKSSFYLCAKLEVLNAKQKETFKEKEREINPKQPGRVLT